MNIIVDESVDHYFVRELRLKGFVIISIGESFSSLQDESILSMSLFPPSIIITEDKDFGDLVFHRQLKVYAIILMRYKKDDREQILQRLLILLLKYPDDLLNSFSVITFNKTRYRKLDF